KQRGAKIDVWGVGTKLSTGQPDAALGGVYKLGATRRPGGEWQYHIKLSEESAKTSVPGSLQVRRFHHPDGRFMADAIYETDHGVREPCVIFDLETNKEQAIADDSRAAMPVGEAVGFPQDVVPYSNPATHTDLLVPIFRHGEPVYEQPSLEATREHLRKQLSCAPPEILQLNDPTCYKVGLERSLHELRSKLIAHAKEQ